MSRGDGIARGDAVPPFSFPAPVPPARHSLLPIPVLCHSSSDRAHCPWRIRRGGERAFRQKMPISSLPLLPSASFRRGSGGRPQGLLPPLPRPLCAPRAPPWRELRGMGGEGVFARFIGRGACPARGAGGGKSAQAARGMGGGRRGAGQEVWFWGAKGYVSHAKTIRFGRQKDTFRGSAARASAFGRGAGRMRRGRNGLPRRAPGQGGGRGL